MCVIVDGGQTLCVLNIAAQVCDACGLVMTAGGGGA